MPRSIYRIGATGPRPVTPPQPDDTPIVAALRFGVTAPSAHNTQPWRVELVSDTEAQLFFDPDRMLPETDPPGRQVHISHGTFAEMAAIAATSLGYRADLDILPEGEMTIPEFGTKPTATIRLTEDAGLETDQLFAQVRQRRSSRLAHEGPDLTESERTTIQQQADVAGVEVGWIRDDAKAEALRIIGDGMSLEARDHALYDETRYWFRFNEKQIAEKGDGLHADTSGASGVSLWLARTFMNDGTFHTSLMRDPYLKRFRQVVDTTRGLLTLTTATNTMFDWITTGRAYVRAQLAASELGLRFQPTSQVLQEFPQMDRLRTEMEHLVGVQAPAKLQMLVRVGRTKPPALAPRRDLATIISS